jgi:3-isopropylmalate dehydratase small subunit
MESVLSVKGKSAYLPLANIDTDMIIPKQYLKTIKRSGLGKFLFAELRYDMNNREIPDFILNKKRDASILLAMENFGCGSSREHAPWALKDFGIRAVIAPSFADIFYSNSFKNGMLLVRLPKENIEFLAKIDGEISIDLVNQKVKAGGKEFPFNIEAHNKAILVEGLDDIQKILRYEKDIAEFEQKHFKKQPWLVLNREAGK